jgi:hypothetical protein
MYTVSIMNGIKDLDGAKSTRSERQFKGTVRRKPRWVKSGLNRWLFLYCLAADIFNFYLKGHYSLKSIKPVSAFNDHKN